MRDALVTRGDGLLVYALDILFEIASVPLIREADEAQNQVDLDANPRSDPYGEAGRIRTHDLVRREGLSIVFCRLDYLVSRGRLLDLR